MKTICLLIVSLMLACSSSKEQDKEPVFSDIFSNILKEENIDFRNYEINIKMQDNIYAISFMPKKGREYPFSGEDTITRIYYVDGSTKKIVKKEEKIPKKGSMKKILHNDVEHVLSIEAFAKNKILNGDEFSASYDERIDDLVGCITEDMFEKNMYGKLTLHLSWNGTSRQNVLENTFSYAGKEMEACLVEKANEIARKIFTEEGMTLKIVYR